MFHDERRFPQFVFDSFFEVQDLQASQCFFGQVVFGLTHAQFLQGLHEPRCVVYLVASFSVLDDRFTNGETRKGLGQINWLTSVGELQMAHGVDGCIAYQFFGKPH